ncbi:hypothetical protein OG234_13605 [Streptomyces sp. NBC_01420]|uniref:hypothetical protein n=1 Tax=Streptomyces sp. NBC_01420 TaxID=2903858 RepID=UPI003248501C
MEWLILTGSMAGTILAAAAVGMYRATKTTRTWVDAGTCSGDDCRDCRTLLHHPAHGRTRAVLRASMPQQRSGTGGAL